MVIYSDVWFIITICFLQLFHLIFFHYSNINSLKNTIDKVKNLKEKITNNFEIVEELKNSYDEELLELVSNEINNIKNEIDDVEVLLLLSGPYDK